MEQICDCPDDERHDYVMDRYEDRHPDVSASFRSRPLIDFAVSSLCFSPSASSSSVSSGVPPSHVPPSCALPSRVSPSRVLPSRVSPSRVSPSRVSPSRVLPSRVLPSVSSSRILPGVPRVVWRPMLVVHWHVVFSVVSSSFGPLLIPLLFLVWSGCILVANL